MYLHEQPNWTHFTLDYARISPVLAALRHHQGRVAASFALAGIDLREGNQLETLVADVVKSSEIEGEVLSPASVRSSLLRKLGLSGGDEVVPREVDGAVEVTLDALKNCAKPLTEERLFAWHAALFPSGYSGLVKLHVGMWRIEEMQVVSGGFGHERVHYEAPKPERVPAEMARFLEWFNADTGEDLLVKAAVAHVWFVMIHPFDDGNGRIARALTDLLVSRSDGGREKLYSLSSEILSDRKHYYSLLELAGRAEGDLTEWVLWFLSRLECAMSKADEILERTLRKAAFWERHGADDFNARQIKMINLLFDGFEGKLTSGKWANICKCSSDTALNDITALLRRGVLKKAPEGGRSVNYLLCAHGG